MRGEYYISVMPETPSSYVAPWADWAELAEQDYRVAERLLSDADMLFFRSVGFHSQQSAEKYLKALLVFKNVAFPKTMT